VPVTLLFPTLPLPLAPLAALLDCLLFAELLLESVLLFAVVLLFLLFALPEEDDTDEEALFDVLIELPSPRPLCTLPDNRSFSDSLWDWRINCSIFSIASGWFLPGIVM
jgi:hypothetical protein